MTALESRTGEPRHAAAPPTRRRGRELQQAIYQATFEQLREVGYAGLTMDGVAAAARTGKAPLYRRWPDKDALLVDALRDRLPSADDIPLAGDLRSDLIAILRFLRGACAITADTALQTVKQQSEGVHAMMRERISEPTRRLILETLRAAEERGDTRPGSATPLTARVGPAMIAYQNLSAPTELTDEFVVSVVDEVLLPMLRGPA
ncbi:TetR/AcrR family transcriptional regulator [Embleya scabrispora]|uniref:TetR/AcrR family transcriptional regulator n=1 Tax=Embleya scabrispora TaxID=159449 RepID=UPI00035C4D8B